MRVKSIIFFTIVILTILMNVPEMSRLWRSTHQMHSSWQDGQCNAGNTIDSAREMALFVKTNNKEAAYCRSSEKGVLPIERTRILAMSWDFLPNPIQNGMVQDVIGADAIVAAEYEPFIEQELTSKGYRISKSGGGVNLWCRGDDWDTEPARVEHRRWISEIFSVVAMLIFLLCCYFISGHDGVILGLTFLSLGIFVFGGILGITNLGMALFSAILVCGALWIWKQHKSVNFSFRQKIMSFRITKPQGLMLLCLFFI